MLTEEERFWAKVEKTDNCWVWKASVGSHGYGQFVPTHGRIVLAHRFAYELLIGTIPEGKQLDHLCRNRTCVNPLHMEPVTQRENLLRGDTIISRCLQKTHCPQGHPLDGDNLDPFFLRRGWRQCKTCILEHNRINSRNYRQRKKCARSLNVI